MLAMPLSIERGSIGIVDDVDIYRLGRWHTRVLYLSRCTDRNLGDLALQGNRRFSNGCRGNPRAFLKIKFPLKFKLNSQLILRKNV